MPRSSRHKSHRLHKHGSESEDDGNERKPRADEPAAGSSARVSRDAEGSSARVSREAETEKRKSVVKDPMNINNGDASGEHGRKRKGRVDDSVVDDRWNGGGEDEHGLDKKSKPEVFEAADSEKGAKSKISVGDSKSRSSRKEESGGRADSSKPRVEKDSSRRESTGSQYKNVKEKERDYNKDAKEKDRDYSKDAKERDRDHSKDAKEKDRDYSKDAKEKDRDYSKDAKEKDRDYSKDAKERDRDYSKDAKERDKDFSKDAKERDRDYTKDAKERDRDYYKEDRDRDYYKDAKERDKDNYKDVKEKDREYLKDARERDRDTKDRDKDYSKDARERDRDHSKDVRERDRDYSKDARERDRERGSDRDKRAQDGRNERSDDVAPRKQASKIISSEEEHGLKKNMEISGGKLQDGVHNPEPEKEPDKHTRRRDGSGDKDKSLVDGRDSDDRRYSSRDDHTKISSHKDESQREGRYRDRYREDLDRDQRHRDDRGRDERSSRDHNSSRPDKNSRDEYKLPESRYKKSKIQDTDRDASPCIDDHGTKLKDNRGRKRSSDGSDEHIDLKPRGAKEPREDVEKNASSTSKVDSSLGSNRPKGSPSSGNHSMKDQIRASLKQERLSTASRDHVNMSGAHERDSESRSSEKSKLKVVRSGEADYDKTKSDTRTSPNPLVEKPPLTASDRRFSDKSGARRSLDSEGHKSGSSRHGRDNSNIKDRERGLPSEKSISNDLSRGEMLESESIPSGLSSFNRTNHLSSSSPSHPPLPPHPGHRTGSPSVLGSYEDDNRSQIGDRKPNSRYKRSGEHSMGRGQGNAWKSSPSTWPSPVPNGFFPLHHGPPPPGFHPGIQQFPTGLFGVRPPMEMNHAGVSYHMHDHVRPFGWHNPVDDCPPPLQVWDGRNSVFGDESHLYGRPEWEMNRQLMSSRGWEMSADMWKAQNGNMNIELPMPQESEYSAGSEAWSRRERVPSECLPDDNSEVKRPNDKSPAENAVEIPQKGLLEKTTELVSKTTAPEATKTPNQDSNIDLCTYLYKLDISVDLVRPDRYQECMSVLRARDKATVYNNVPNQENYQSNKGDIRAAAQSTSHILSSLFPSRTDAVFQRAITLNNKHNSGRKAICSGPPSSCPEVKASPDVSETEKSRGVVDKQTISADTSLAEEFKVAADNQVPLSGTSLANADLTNAMGDGRKPTADPEGSSDPSDANMEQQYDSISGAVHFVEGSQSCETVMGDCRVNLRIHFSPGSSL